MTSGLSAAPSQFDGGVDRFLGLERPPVGIEGHVVVLSGRGRQPGGQPDGEPFTELECERINFGGDGTIPW